jgi:hypothetical protein
MNDQRLLAGNVRHTADEANRRHMPSPNVGTQGGLETIPYWDDRHGVTMYLPSNNSAEHETRLVQFPYPRDAGPNCESLHWL